MKITKRQLKRIIREEFDVKAVQDHAKDIVDMFLDEVIKYVRQDIVPEHAPALAGITMADFLQAAADRARQQDASELVSDYGMNK